MAVRKLLVLVNNLISELPIGDTVDITFDPQFSYEILAADLSIPVNQQMIVMGTFDPVNYTLTLVGSLCLI